MAHANTSIAHPARRLDSEIVISRLSHRRLPLFRRVDRPFRRLAGVVTEALGPFSSPSGVGAAPVMRVVIADDDALSNTHLARLLEAFAHVEVVGVAADGREAVDIVDRLDPDLLFVDVEMPKLNGFQVLESIKLQPLVIIVTAHTEYRHLTLDTDALYCLRKPFDAAELHKAMDKIDRLARVMARIGARLGEA
jgi:CheY-like chemotaxis protein